MALKRAKHDTLDAVEEEFKNLEQTKAQEFVWNATRAPNASDKTSRVWFWLNGSTLRMYVYDTVAGAWRGPTTFS